MLYFVTGSAGKFHEFQAQIPKLKQLKLDLDEIQSLDPRIVIEHKLEQAATLHDGALIVEDTSLSMDALRGLPGTFIKWFIETLDVGGIAELVAPYDDHRATARTVIGYRNEKGERHFFEGVAHGTIAESPRGSGFGWDAIFIPEGYDKTFGELGPEIKQKISMRRHAIDALMKFLSTTTPASR